MAGRNLGHPVTIAWLVKNRNEAQIFHELGSDAVICTEVRWNRHDMPGRSDFSVRRDVGPNDLNPMTHDEEPGTNRGLLALWDALAEKGFLQR
jgi:hypothetical protein